MSFIKGLIACVLVAAAVAAKLEPHKVVKRGVIEHRIFFDEYSTEDSNTKEIFRYLLGECFHYSGEEPDGIRILTQAQTFKNSDVIEYQAQEFSDRRCMKRTGKATTLGRFHDKKLIHSKHGMDLQKSLHKQGLPSITMPGLIVNAHLGEDCNVNHSPVYTHFVAPSTCSNTTISDNSNAKSLLNYAEYGFVYEYSDANCMGNSSIIYLPDPMYNPCWSVGGYYYTFQVNH